SASGHPARCWRELAVEPLTRSTRATLIRHIRARADGSFTTHRVQVPLLDMVVISLLVNAASLLIFRGIDEGIRNSRAIPLTLHQFHRLKLMGLAELILRVVPH